LIPAELAGRLDDTVPGSEKGNGCI
jgi:hypothetical protein